MQQRQIRCWLTKATIPALIAGAVADEYVISDIFVDMQTWDHMHLRLSRTGKHGVVTTERINVDGAVVGLADYEPRGEGGDLATDSACTERGARQKAGGE